MGGGFGRQTGERGGAMFTPNELVFTSGGFYVCANFGENSSRNANVRLHADGHTDRGKLVLCSIPCYMGSGTAKQVEMV